LDHPPIIFSKYSEKVPLVQGQEADIIIDCQYSKILRHDLHPTEIISSSVADGYLASEIVGIIKSLMEKESKKWTSGYTHEYGGDAAGSNH
jgi:hypothetical protein